MICPQCGTSFDGTENVACPGCLPSSAGKTVAQGTAKPRPNLLANLPEDHDPLATFVAEDRSLLDSGRIITVHAAPAQSAALMVEQGRIPKEEYRLRKGENIIGRSDGGPVSVDLKRQEDAKRRKVSRRHACIRFERGKLAIEDLESANGTFVNGRRVRPGKVQALRERDQIDIGSVRLILRCNLR